MDARVFRARFLTEDKNFLFSRACSPSLRPICVPKDFTAGIKRPVCESNHRTISPTEVKNARYCILLPCWFSWPYEQEQLYFTFLNCMAFSVFISRSFILIFFEGHNFSLEAAWPAFSLERSHN